MEATESDIWVIHPCQ